MIKSICFDFGGTLGYRVGGGFCSRVASYLGDTIENVRPVVDKYFRTNNTSYDSVYKSFFNELKATPPEKAYFFDSIRQNVHIYDDVIPTLNKLKYYHLGIISNTTIWETADLFDLGIGHFFSSVIYSYNAKAVKPHSKIYKEYEKQNNLTSENIIFVGDSILNDITGAKKLGWKTIYINRDTKPYPSFKSKADYDVKSLLELPSAISSIEKKALY